MLPPLSCQDSSAVHMWSSGQSKFQEKNDEPSTLATPWHRAVSSKSNLAAKEGYRRRKKQQWSEWALWPPQQWQAGWQHGHSNNQPAAATTTNSPIQMAMLHLPAIVIIQLVLVDHTIKSDSRMSLDCHLDKSLSLVVHWSPLFVLTLDAVLVATLKDCQPLVDDMISLLFIHFF